MTLHYVEVTIAKNGVLVSYEKPNFNSKEDAIEHYNKLWWTYKDCIFNETHLAFMANTGNEAVSVRVGATVL